MEEASSSDILEAEILGITFGLATHREIRTASISDAGINHVSQLSNSFLGLPLEFGKCESCGATEPDKCEGHFGYIHLPVPIFHPAYVKELKQILSLLCLKCLRIKKAKSTSAAAGLAERVLGVCCEESASISIKDKKSDGASYLELKFPSRSRLQEGCWNFLERYGYRYGSGYTRPLLAREVKEILRKIPEETRRKLTAKGHIPQEGYILEYLPVPPNCLSVPEASDGFSSMSVDPSRIELKDVLRKAVAINNSRSGETNFESHHAEANEIFRAVDNYLRVRGTTKPTRNIDMRYGVSKVSDSSSSKAWAEKMKTLFIRKGSGFCSRSVITGDAYRNVNEVGIPMEIAHRITFEERVNVHNVAYLQELVDNKMCLSYRQGATTYSLRDGSKGHTVLKPGQVVHRRVMDGDVVFMNRPPTTHKHSLQALKVYVHEDNTVKINPLICGPLGADFDGDCVHLFYPQSLTAKAEVTELFSVDKQLRSSHTGQLILQMRSDSLLSLRVMLEQVVFHKAFAQQLAMYASLSLPPPALRKSSNSGPAWTSFQILQLAFPERLSCKGDRFMVAGSDLLLFDLGVDALASVINEVVTAIMLEKGPKEALGFFDSLQPLLMEHLDPLGFSLSLEDLSMSRKDMDVIHNLISREISPLVSRLRLSYEDELQLENSIHKVKEVAANFMLKSYSMRNLVDMTNNGAINKLVQQIGFLGLQLSEKKKLYTKTLVEDMAQFCKRKYARTSHSGDFGMVKGCFFHGLDPYEEMAHSIAAREVIVRSSSGLAEPGTLFKNLMAVLRDIVITNDGTVRNTSSNSIVQFKYEVSSDSAHHQGLFEAGDPVGVLAATAMSTPAYKAVLDSSPNSNSTWELMKEVLLCKANFQNNVNDRRVILYLNACGCGKKYCQENAACTVKNKLKRISLKDAAVEFLVEHRKPQAVSEVFGTESCLHGHIHLNKTLLDGWNISVQDIRQKCQEVINSLAQKKKTDHFKRMNLVDRQCCSFGDPSASKDAGMPCLIFSSNNSIDQDLERTLDVLCNAIYPVLLETVIKGDPRISSANIVWNSPDTTTWIRSPHVSRRGEWVLHITVEKSAVKKSGDAWRVVIDSCLSVLHLIDTKRSIPYSIKQVQELLGLSCAFEQAVQRLSASVRKVSKGVLKEHIILVANTMTCSGDMLGFNPGGYKALSRSLSIKAPFTEATLIAPRKCFEKAAEKCHKDSLSSVVGSCSWGKRVDVGTGSQFELLWNKKETGLENDDETDVFSFLQMVRSTKSADAYISSSGFDVTEEDMAEWAESPERDAALGEPKFEDSAEFQNILDEGKTSESKWDNGSDGGSEWGVSKTTGGEENPQSNWGKKTEVESNAAAAWGSNANKNPGAESDAGAGWGSIANKNPVDESDASSGWGSNANKNPEAGLSSAAAAWGSNANKNPGAGASSAWGSNANKNPGADTSSAWGSNVNKNLGADASSAWGSRDEMNKEETTPVALGSWGKKSLETEPGSAAWGKKSLETESDPVAWGSMVKQNSETETDARTWGTCDKGKSKNKSGPASWGSQTRNKSESETGAAAWGSRDKKTSESELGASAWGAKEKNIPETGSGSAPWSSWGQTISTASDKDAKEDDGNPWVSLKGTNSREKDGNESSQWGIPTKKYPAASSQGGWSNGGGADGKRNRPPRTPGSVNNVARMLTATGQRVDMFTTEEQELLSDVEPVMRRLRNIMHHSGYTDGEPISDDDKTYVLEQILNFHPEKESKLGSGLDFITVDKHTTFTDSRCFFVVSTDGVKEDFSYRKCINNYLVEKYPNLAEEFIAKYYKKRDTANRERNSQDATPPGNASTGEKESQTELVGNAGVDSKKQALGNGGDDSETQAQPIGDGGEDS